MQRIKLVIQYDGSDFVGWQRQKNGRTVQQEIECAINKITAEDVTVVGSSRTDAKVHALNQVVHFDTNSTIPANRFKIALNDILPDDVSVISSKKVSPNFHARFDVKKKSYEYYLSTEKQFCPLKRKYMTHIEKILDIDKMRKCAELFLGTHNFKGFCSAQAQVKNFERTIYTLKITQKKDVYRFLITGSGFLQHMVRIIVGTLVEVGYGKILQETVKSAIDNGDRKLAGRTMPPQGLYLKKIYF